MSKFRHALRRELQTECHTQYTLFVKDGEIIEPKIKECQNP
jgi:hypothetical protein